MITITIFQNQGTITGFNCIGHAEYADAGKDIVCAAASMLVINTINSLEKLTHEKFSQVANQQEGLIDIRFQSEISDGGKLLMDSMILGLQEIRKKYGKKFLKLDFKEV